MAIGILHLSDIHFRASRNPVLERQEPIVNAFASRLGTNAAPLIAITGDIAFSGKDEEYEVAREFLSGIREKVSARLNLTPESIPVVMVPGNHDCDFAAERGIRQSLLEVPIAQLANRLIEDSSIADELTSIQRGYFKLMNVLSPTPQTRTQFSKLAWAFNVRVNGVAVSNFCYNTAWVSQVKERQGQLHFPLEAIPPPEVDSPLVISLFHHPYNWQEASASRAFRHRIEDTSDIVLTGHEHESDVRTQQDQRSDTTLYIEGDILQDSESKHRSGFNVITIDLNDQNWRVLRFSWNLKEGLYAPTEEGPWHPLGRSKRSRQNFVNTPDFLNDLSDSGTTFTHPRVRKLTVQDLFVYPDVEVSNPSDRANSEVLSGSDLTAFVLKEQRCFVVGSTRSGKTALSKILYGDLRSAGRVPLLLSSTNLKLRDVKDSTDLLRVAFGRQYGPDHFEKFFQLAPDARAVIVDDLHRSGINAEARARFVHFLTSMFGIVILFVDEEFALDSAINGPNLELFATEFRVCKLRELGHLKRDQLIRLWCNLGDSVSEEDDRAYRVAEIQKTINTVLGRRLLPSYPIFVLTLLQILETGRNPKTITGSYGYIYETLIAMALARSGGTETLDTKFTYLSCIAYRMFKTGQHRLDKDAVEEVASEYFERYRIRIPLERMGRELQESDVLVTHEERVAFHYSYLYYFFVAKYFQENVDSSDDGEDIRSELTDLGSRLFNDDAANILMFYVYLTKDQVLIRAVVAQAREIFKGVAPCDFTNDVKFVIQPGAAPSLMFSQEKKGKARERYLASLDHVEERKRTDVEEDNQEPTGLMGEINVATKTIQVIGQILRNFPGSLRGDIKLQMAAETYRLGLRTLGAALREMGSILEEVKEHLKEHPSGSLAELSEEERERKLNRLAFFFSLIVANAAIRNVADAVGTSQLRETYREVLSEESSIGTSLIDLAVKINHFKPFPEEELFKIYKSARDNPFEESLLRLFTLQFIYLFPCRQSFVQKVCNRLGIPIKANERYLDQRSKV